MSSHYSHPDPTIRELLAAAYEQGKKDAALDILNSLLGDERQAGDMYQ